MNILLIENLESIFKSDSSACLVNWKLVLVYRYSTQSRKTCVQRYAEDFEEKIVIAEQRFKVRVLQHRFWKVG